MAERTKLQKRRFIFTAELRQRFLRHLEDIAQADPDLCIEGAPPARSVLELLSYHFFDLPGACAAIGEHWKKRRRAAYLLIKHRQTQIDCARILYYEEAWIKTRMLVYCSGRLFAKDIGMDSPCYIDLLDDLVRVQERLPRMLTDLIGKRKPRVDDDGNFFLYLMAAYLKHMGENRDLVVDRQIAAFVNAWRRCDESEEEDLDLAEIRRRIKRFGKRNPDFAALIKVNPIKYVLRFFEGAHDGLRPPERAAS